MKKIDHLVLDGHSLQLFLTVLEQGSVTAAAERLEMTQSAVSHAVQKLRRVVGDPLFVKSGRGIVATAHALTLAARARALIEGLEDFARAPEFDPAQARLSLTVGANDFQAELLLPEVFRRLSAIAGRVELRIIPSGAPSADLLRDRRCDLVISPLPPVATDIVQRKIFEDRYVCFFDSTCRSAPATGAEYLAARHATVVHADSDRLEFDKRLDDLGIVRDVVIRVPGFGGVPNFLKGTDMLASLPGLLSRNLMQGFAQVPVPKLPGLGQGVRQLPMFMAWHQRDHLNPAHLWLRSVLLSVAQDTARGENGG